MAVPTTIGGDLVVRGALQATSMTIPAGSVNNNSIPSGAEISVSKVEHQHRFKIDQDGTAAAFTRSLYFASGASATLVDFSAALATACTGNATVTVDLHKNGSTILSSTADFSSSEANREVVSGAFSSSAVSTGDFFQVVVTVDAGTGALGTDLVVILTVNEGFVS